MQHPRYFDNALDDDDEGGEISEAQKDYVPVLLSIIYKNCPPLPENCDGGLYVGAGGIAYAYYHVAQCPIFAEKKDYLLNVAEKYIKVCLREIRKMDPSKSGLGGSLLLGHAGTYGCAALIYDALGLTSLRNENLQSFFSMQKICLPMSFFKHGSDELFVGRAGYLAMSNLLNSKIQSSLIPNDLTLPLCYAIIESGRQCSIQLQHDCPLMYSYYDSQYLGAAHGLCSILLMLLMYPECYSNNPSIENDIKGSIEYVLSCEQDNGNYPPTPGEIRDNWNELVHWCHGASGVIYLFAKAYLVWDDDRFLQAALRCGEVVWRQGLLKKGPGICHGIAGNGYVFLLLYRLTKESKFFRRARQFASFMQTEEFKASSRVPDAPYSLCEGIAGTACYLADLLNPDCAAFPFMDIF